MVMTKEEYDKSREDFFNEYWNVVKNKVWIEIGEENKVCLVPKCDCRTREDVSREEYDEAFWNARPKW